MKKGYILSFLVILLVGLYVFYIFASTGYFRKITPVLDGEVYASFDIPGVEDIAVSYEDKFLILSSDDRKSRKNGNPEQGGIYFLDLTRRDLVPRLISGSFGKTLYPHGISLFRIDSMNYRLWVINHVRGIHTIEVFRFGGQLLLHEKTITDESMLSPNDVAALSENTFYFTNDHRFLSGPGRLAEDYLGLKVSNVMWYDGSAFKEVATGIAYANGLNYDVKRNLLFVASPRGFLVNVYQPVTNGDLVFLESIPAGTGVDNIEFDENGNLLIGCHPNLLAFTAYAAGKKPYAPSEVIRISYDGDNDYDISTLWMDDGKIMSASAVAVMYRDKMFVGNVMDDHFVVLKMNRE